MDIQVNGKATQIEDGINIQSLLSTLGYKDGFVAVAVNSRCIPRRNFQEHLLNASDEVEILAPMAGG